jgi:phosphoribosylformylglycinamidine synthase I
VKSAVIVFPGSNCDRDVAVTLEAVTGKKPAMVWHRETSVPAVDLIVLPGGFSYGDYLRSGAMAAHSPIMRAVSAEGKRGVAILGICNGFQILTEAQLLPGALMRNSSLHYICRDVGLKVERADTPFTNAYAPAAALLACLIAPIVSWASCPIPNAPPMPPSAARTAAACSSR